MARIVFTDFREPAAAQAYEIALDYLLRSGQVGNEYEVFLSLAHSLTRMVDAGQNNRIRMANKAIAEYERQSREARAFRELTTPSATSRGWLA